MARKSFDGGSFIRPKLLLSMITGERLTVARFVGMACTITGVILVARGETHPGDANPIDETKQPAKKNLGLGFALLYASRGQRTLTTK